MNWANYLLFQTLSNNSSASSNRFYQNNTSKESTNTHTHNTHTQHTYTIDTDTLIEIMVTKQATHTK